MATLQLFGRVAFRPTTVASASEPYPLPERNGAFHDTVHLLSSAASGEAADDACASTSIRKNVKNIFLLVVVERRLLIRHILFCVYRARQSSSAAAAAAASGHRSCIVIMVGHAWLLVIDKSTVPRTGGLGDHPLARAKKDLVINCSRSGRPDWLIRGCRHRISVLHRMAPPDPLSAMGKKSKGKAKASVPAPGAGGGPGGGEKRVK